MIKLGVILMCIIMIVNNCYDLNGYLKKMLFNIVYCMKFMLVFFCCSYLK